MEDLSSYDSVGCGRVRNCVLGMIEGWNIYIRLREYLLIKTLRKLYTDKVSNEAGMNFESHGYNYGSCAQFVHIYIHFIQFIL